MELNDFIEENEISSIFRYEEKLDKNVVYYGWVDSDSIDLSKPMVMSYHSRSKFATKEESARSRKEGNTIALLDDYIKFFVAKTDMNPSEFYNKWKDEDEEVFKKSWQSQPFFDDKEHLFYLKIARLIVTGQKFTMYSRGFKVINLND